MQIEILNPDIPEGIVDLAFRYPDPKRFAELESAGRNLTIPLHHVPVVELHLRERKRNIFLGTLTAPAEISLPRELPIREWTLSLYPDFRLSAFLVDGTPDTLSRIGDKVLQRIQEFGEQSSRVPNLQKADCQSLS